MRDCRLLTSLFTLAVPALVFAQLDTVWLRQYDGGRRDEDQFSDMYVDSVGNVYVCGTGYTGQTSMWDILVRKYGPNGESLWTAIYDGPWHRDDSAAAMAVDAAGNVYVCGWSTDSAWAYDLVTVKFNSTGTLAWAKLFSRGTGDNAANAIALDRLGRVIVTGYASDTIPGNIDYCTISYSAANGDTAWVRYYNRTPENDEDVAVSLCVDDSNNVYVTGYSYDDGTDYDFATIRYSPTGTQNWLRRFNYRPWSYDDYGTKIVFDRLTRSVVVGGTVYDENQDYNYFTIKYGSRLGDSLWARAYNRYPANDDDWLQTVTLDGAGNVYVTGTSSDNITNYDVATVKYSPAGAQRWVARFDESGDEDGGVDLKVDASGNVYVIGFGSAPQTDFDLVVIKLDSTGTQRWAYVWDHPLAHTEDLGSRIALRPDGCIIVGGTTFDNRTDYDLLTMKLRELAHDFGVELLGMPDSLWFTDTLWPVAIVRNLATNADSCWTRLTLSPGSYRDSFWVVLGVNSADTVRFGPWLPDTLGLITATAWVSLPVDERRSNDTAVAWLIVWNDTTGLAARQNTSLPFGLSVFPNPIRCHGRFLFRCCPDRPSTLTLYDITGAAVWSTRNDAHGRDAVAGQAVEFNARLLPAGVYFLKLRQGTLELNHKVIVQR